MTLERRIRRLLRWYPRSWRAANEDVVFATMMDAADGSPPSHAERRAIVIEGLGMRLDARLALVVGALALLLAAVAGFASFWGATTAALPLTLVIVPMLVGIGLVALLRHAELVSAGGALLAVVLTAVAFVLSGLTATAWSLGFDAADEGVPATGLAALWVPLFLVAWGIGAFAVGVVATGMLGRTRMPRALALVTAVTAGVVTAPIVGVSTISPVTSLIGAVGLCVISFFVLRRPAPTMDTGSAHVPVVAPSRAEASRTLPPRTRRTARLLAGISAIGATVGIVYALTGAGWSRGASDSTVAMAQGITIALVSAIPLLAGAVVVSRAPGARGTAATVVPYALAALSLGAGAVGYLWAPSWSGMAPAFAVSSALAGAAIAWLIVPRLPGALPARLTVGVLIGLGYAAFLGGMIVPALAFVVPIVAVVFAVTIGRGRIASSTVSTVGPSSEPLPN